MSLAVAQPDITIREVEVELTRLRPNWAAGVELRELALLFAILKVGQSTQKLVWFTDYPATFVINLVEELRQRGKLFTGLSPQFVLSQCPGSEDLIAVVTGARPFVPTTAPVKPIIRLAPVQPVVKEKVMSKPNPTPDAENCWCGRPARHRGVHKRQGTNQHTKQEKSAKIESATAIAEIRQAEPKLVPARVSNCCEKAVQIGGGSLRLVADGVNLLELSDRDRELIYSMTGLMSKYQEAV